MKFVQNLVRAVVVVLMLLLQPISCGSQTTPNKESKLKFTSKEWDFGVIKEVDGEVTHTFKFTNEDKSALIIEQVYTTCGCVRYDYPRRPIKSGESAEIAVVYDPENRPGIFARNIYITTGGGKQEDVLTIKGEVLPRKRSVEEDYPYLIGEKVRVNTIKHYRRFIEQAEPVSFVVGYVNDSKSGVKIDFQIEPKMEQVWVDAPDDLCAGCRGDFTVNVFFPQGSGVYGKQDVKIHPIINGQRSKTPIVLNTAIVDNFAKVDKERAPRLRVEFAHQHLGQMRAGERRSGEFVLTNSGSEPLVIRTVNVSPEMSSSIRGGTTIESGKSLTVKCELTVKQNKGIVIGVVTLVVNDPLRPIQELRLVAEVK